LVYYVSPNGSDTTGTGSVSSPFATISHAVAQATATGNASTVLVGPGTYSEMIVITTPVKLLSLSGQPSNTIVDARGLPNGIVVVGPKAAGSVVGGFTVENADNHGIYVQDSSNVKVENNVVANNGLNIIKGLGEDKAVQLTGTVGSTVAGNSVVGNLYGGIGVADDGPVNPSWNATAVPGTTIPAGTANPGNNNVISSNTVANNRPNHCAIVVSSYDSGEGVANNIVSNNLVVDNQNGVIVAADLPNTAAVNNTVIGNSIIDNGEGGVIVHNNAPGDVVTGNVISGNVFSGDGYLPTLEGVIVGGEGPVAVRSTTITGNTFQNEGIGIMIVNGQGTMVGGNVMGATVKLAVNGTVTTIQTGGGGQVTTVTTTVSSVSTVTSTSTVSANATSTSSVSGGITFSLALVTAVGTLIVGLIAGMVARPIREAAAS
jgi:parallel beta-helix repeat protein